MSGTENKNHQEPAEFMLWNVVRGWLIISECLMATCHVVIVAKPSLSNHRNSVIIYAISLMM